MSQRGDLSLNGPLDKVTFSLVVVNDGNVWNRVTNTASIRVSGNYYLHINMATCFNMDAKLDVKINNKVDFSDEYLMYNKKYSMKRSRSVLRKLSSGDTITISMTTQNTCLWFSTFTTSFYGFYHGP